MADLFNDLKKKAEELKKETSSLKTLAGEYCTNMTSRCEVVEKEIDKLLVTSLASSGEWDKVKDSHADIIKNVEERLPAKIQTIKKSIDQASRGLAVGTKEARKVVLLGISFLILISTFYILLHYCPKIPSYSKVDASRFFEAIGKAKAAVVREEVNGGDVVKAIEGLKIGDDVLTLEFSETVHYLKGYVPTFGSGEKLQTQKDQRLVEIRKAIEDMEKSAKGLAKNDGFFWVTRYWKWLEIVFWGEFGVIVGILVWVSTQVQAGRYTRMTYEEEKYWYLTEVFIGPIVVAAVFFLLKQFVGTLIEGITEEEVRGSVYTTLGISFTLGLFLRRTLGIFNVIKDRLPLPK